MEKASNNRREEWCSNQLVHELSASKMSGAGKMACGKAAIGIMLIGVVVCGGITIGRENNAKEITWDRNAQFESKIGEIARGKIHERERKEIKLIGVAASGGITIGRFCFVLFCLACNSRCACGGSRYRCGDFPTRS